MAIGDLIQRPDDAPLYVSRSTGRNYPGAPGSVSGHIISNDGEALPARPILDVVGTRIDAHDGLDATVISLENNLLVWAGTWVGILSYIANDVVTHRGAHWRATSETTAEPGTASTAWVLLGGVPVMTTAQVTAWTGAANGNTVFDTTLDRLFIRDSTTWRPAHIEPVGFQVGLNTAAGPFNDATKRTLFTRTLSYAGTVTVSGVADISVTNTAGVTEVRIEGELQRGGTSVGTIAGACSRGQWTLAGAGTYAQSIPFGFIWYDARPSDVVVYTVHRISGTGTYNYNVADGRYHGVTVIEQP